MKVKCINQGNFRNITLNDEYDVITDNENTYEIISDNFIPRIYSKKYFEVIAEPIPDIIEDVEEIGVIEKAIGAYFNDDNDIIVNIEGDNTMLTFYEVASNCGVKSYHRMNYLFENCSHNIDLFKRVMLEVIDVVIEDHSSCMLIFSTNDEYKDIWTVLDAIMDTKSETVENPNSDMNVKLWIKYV